MKKLLILLPILLLSLLSWAQTPGTINYQAAIKNNDGSPLANTEVTVEVTIATATDSYTDEQTAQTDAFGIVNLQIGGEELKNFDWAAGGATYNNITVTGLRNTPANNATPQQGDILTFENGQWRPLPPGPPSIKVHAGAVGSAGNPIFSSPNVNITVLGNTEIRVGITGTSLNASNCSAVATSRGTLSKFYNATFSNGEAVFKANDNARTFPMNFIIYH